MAMSDKDDAAEFDFASSDPRPAGGASRARDVARFLTDSSRIRIFLTLAGLVEAGLDLRDAAALVADGYEGSGILKDADAIKGFFEAAATEADPVKLRDAARAAFGTTFVSIEELLLLSALPRSPDKAATLRAIAGLISLKDGKGHGQRKA